MTPLRIADQFAKQFEGSTLSKYAIANRLWRLRHLKPGMCTRCVKRPQKIGRRYCAQCLLYSKAHMAKKAK